MNEYYTIDTISKLLGLPKSTLRYWESEGLIELKRNAENKYREYSITAIFDIMDIMSYRTINMPVKEIQRMKQESSEKIYETLKRKEQQLQIQMEQLKKAQEALERKQHYFELCREVMMHPYEICEPEFEAVIPFSYEKKEHWINCQENNLNFVLCYLPGETLPKDGTVVTEKSDKIIKESQTYLWRKNQSREKKSKFVRCILKTSFQDPKDNDLLEHYQRIEKRYRCTGLVMAQLLFTAYEERKSDYYLTYIEVEEG